jgi:hypothetical protein
MYTYAQTLLNEAEQRNINFIFATYVKMAVVSALNLLRCVFSCKSLINHQYVALNTAVSEVIY